jgi:hypothetical protein
MFKRKRGDCDENPKDIKDRRHGEGDYMLEGIHNTPEDGTRVVYVYQYGKADGWKQIGKRFMGPCDVINISTGGVWPK